VTTSLIIKKHYGIGTECKNGTPQAKFLRLTTLERSAKMAPPRRNFCASPPWNGVQKWQPPGEIFAPHHLETECKNGSPQAKFLRLTTLKRSAKMAAPRRNFCASPP